MARISWSDGRTSGENHQTGNRSGAERCSPCRQYFHLGFTNVVAIPEGSIVTADYRTDRVRVFVDANGIVRSAPTVG